MHQPRVNSDEMRTTVSVAGDSNGGKHNERTACSICRKNRFCNCGKVLDRESDVVTETNRLNIENYNKVLNEIFDVSSKEVSGYSTKTFTLKKVPEVKPQTIVKQTIPSKNQQGFSQRETFIVVDRVPQLHLEAPGDHYIDDNVRSPDLLGTLLKQHSQWRSTSPATEAACIAATTSVASQAALDEKPEQNTDIVSMISKTLSVCSGSENLEENCPAVKGDLHSDQTRSSQPLSGFYDMKGSSAGSYAAKSVTHVGATTSLSGNSPVVGSLVPSSSGGNNPRYGALSVSAGTKSSKVLVGDNAPGVAAGPNAGMVLMMIYGNREECAKVGCGPRWVHRSQIQKHDIPAAKMSKMMDKDGTLDISFDEWRDYLLFHPSANLHDIIHYWRHATNLDIGEDLSVPDDFSHEEWVSGKWWRHLVAGGVAGMVSRTCTAPLDRLRVFLQVHGATKYRSLRDCFKYMIDEGGVKSLWRGNGVNVIKIAPESALKFAAYEQAKGFIMRNFGAAGRELRIEERFAAGSFAGAFSQSVIYPMEVLKTRLAIRKSGQYKGIGDAATQIYRTEGIRSFYRGYVPNLLGIIPYAGIDLAVYETLKRRYARMRPDDKDPSIMVIIGCGALSSSCGQIASYPLALIRTRLQAQVMSKDRVPHPDQPTTPIGLFKQIIKKEGPLGLYRGIAPNFMKVAPAVSISYVVYEKCREALGVRMM